MRTELSSLVGRDHVSYGAYYFPVKNCIDGDLCEAFAILPLNKQRQVATELDRSVSRVSKKTETTRASSGLCCNSGNHSAKALKCRDHRWLVGGGLRMRSPVGFCQPI
ncbi:hypothetical protein PSHT_14001 [Puccinia striiformis]|uniref:Uncharacterized protein n=1 Tax=Puccinia striiformis TaxID=27350 RepID=A0A2S4UMM2_9BASI|nr:hypothetical protein PSHT_14001 [Puccinia striiformis]